MNKYAVVLMNLGGPDSLDAIEPFLNNLFNDPDIFKIPFGQKLFAKIIASKRAPIVAEEYKMIGGNSPINKWTEYQRSELEKELRQINNNIDVYTAMRYWKPLTAETVKKIESQNYDKILLLPLYPHYSVSTTGSSINEWNRHYKGEKEKLVTVNNYYENAKYLAALNERIDSTLEKFDEDIRDSVVFLFSAHGTPVSMAKKGDPYSKQIMETVELVMQGRENKNEYHLCFQSKVGPVKWLEPSTDKTIKQMAEEGKRNLLIVPISFTSDHVETLFELDVEYRHVADENGIKNYIVMEGLNDSALFIDALKEISVEMLNL